MPLQMTKRTRQYDAPASLLSRTASVPGQHQARPGLTLIELVISMTVMTILLLGMASALVIASRAIPDAESPARRFVESAESLLQITDDLRYATTIALHTATVVEFTVPDHNDDGLVETIRYSWSGLAGASLMRQNNGATAVATVDDVHEFQVNYTTSSASGTARVTRVNASLRTGTDGNGRSEAVVELLNQPVWN
jgi:prepilin-type N-terminal cleavage/methylation domain-containing protein